MPGPPWSSPRPGPACAARRLGLAGGIGGRRTGSLAADPRLPARSVAFPSALLSALLPRAAAVVPGRCGAWRAKDARVGASSGPLHSLAARVPQVRAAGRRWRLGLRGPGQGWRRRGWEGGGGGGGGEPGAPCGAAVPEPGPPLASACLSSGAGFLAWRRDPPQRRQEQLRLSVNKLLCGGVSRASGRGVCSFVCVRAPDCVLVHLK